MKEAHSVQIPDWMFLSLLLILAAAMRLYGLRDSPGWYHDETIYIGEAWNLIHGRFQWDAVRHTFLPRLPLFHVILGPMLVLLGKDLIWARLISVFSGVGMAGLIFLTARRCHGRTAAVVSAFLFAVCGYTILSTRWGMTYALDAFLGAMNLYALIRFAQERRTLWLVVSAVFVALGMISDPVMGSRLPVLALVVWVLSGWRAALKAGLAAIVPAMAYVGFMLLFQKTIFIEDLRVILSSRVSSSVGLFTVGASLVDVLKTYGGYAFLGIGGLAFLKDNASRRVIFLVALADMLFIFKLTALDGTLLYRMGIILAPIIFVGCGALLSDIWTLWKGICESDANAMAEWIQSRGRSAPGKWLGRGLIALRYGIVVTLGFLTIIYAAYQISLKFPNMPSHYRATVLEDTKSATEIAEWLNQRLKPDDLTVTTHVEWMLNGRAASPMLVSLAHGYPGSGVYFDGLRDRFVYPCRLDDTRYFVYHDAMPGIAEVYGISPMIRGIQKKWKRVHSNGSFIVYENPLVASSESH